MIANEMCFEFLVGYDKVASLSAPGYEDEEISVLLSQAQERYIKTRYQPLGNKYRKGFEQVEKRRIDLSELIRNYEVMTPSTDQTNVMRNGTLYDLPADFFLAIEGDVVTNQANCGQSANLHLSTDTLNSYTEYIRVPVKPISHDEYIVNVNNPFKKPYCDTGLNEGLVWRLEYSRETLYTNPKRHELITDGTFGIMGYHLRYLRKPNDIVCDFVTTANQVHCELAESTHREIVDIAITIALENIQDPRIQTQPSIQQTNE